MPSITIAGKKLKPNSSKFRYCYTCKATLHMGDAKKKCCRNNCSLKQRNNRYMGEFNNDWSVLNEQRADRDDHLPIYTFPVPSENGEFNQDITHIWFDYDNIDRSNHPQWFRSIIQNPYRILIFHYPKVLFAQFEMPTICLIKRSDYSNIAVGSVNADYSDILWNVNVSNNQTPTV